MSVPRHIQAAGIVRAQIADGTLKPGSPAPSGAALARLTGFASLTCRRAIRELIKDGVLVPGPSPSARPRVAAPDPAGQPRTDATAALSAALAGRRRATGLTQAEFAALAGCSVTTIGHAETGVSGSPAGSGNTPTRPSAQAEACSPSMTPTAPP